MSKTSKNKLITRGSFLKKVALATTGIALTSKSKAINGSMPFSFWIGKPKVTNYSWLFINSSNSYVSLQTQVVFTGSYTVEAWCYPTGTSSNNSTLFAQFNYGSGTDFYTLLTPTSLWFGGDSVSGFGGAVSSTLTLNTWTYYTLSVDGPNNLITLYINGTNVASKSYTGGTTGTSSTPAMIGNSSNVLCPYIGYISNLRVTKSVVYTGNFTPPTTQLTKLTNTVLLAAQNNTYVDNSGTYSLAAGSDVSTSTFSPF
jgi:hypothetical protein